MKDTDNYYYAVSGDDLVKMPTTEEFGTSDFMNENYDIYAEGYFIESMDFRIWQYKASLDEKYPKWIVESGDYYCDYYGFNNSASMMNFIIKLKGDIIDG